MLSLDCEEEAKGPMLTQDIHRHLGLPMHSTSCLSPVDWELCVNIEQCAKQAQDEISRQETNKSSEYEGRKNDSRGLKRGRLPTPDSDFISEENAVVSSHCLRKKQKVEVGEGNTMTFLAKSLSPSESFLRDWSPGTRTMPSLMRDLCASSTVQRPGIMSIEKAEDFPAGGARKTRIQRRDVERQNFFIYEDPDAEDDNGSGSHDLHLSLASWTFPSPDENKENEPAEYEMSANNENDETEPDAFYQYLDFEPQQYREALAEISN